MKKYSNKITVPIKLILNQNELQFLNKHYKKTNGTPVGSCISTITFNTPGTGTQISVLNQRRL